MATTLSQATCLPSITEYVSPYPVVAVPVPPGEPGTPAARPAGEPRGLIEGFCGE